ncbi:cytochrome P450 86B1 [Cryptomeria japonica]|uniref:cytochrome P450 86B1 n=1 Tax=Cryptomeria japonica TaxID=3369 RepID=UPI0027DA27B4|nr:cytochrome P450 86B1 [Cryptomeria japonica]
MIPWVVWHLSNIYEQGVKVALENNGTFLVRGSWFCGSNLFEVVASSPANLEYILKFDLSNFPKGPSKKYFSDIFGYGLINSDDELWKRQQKPTVMAVSSRKFRDRYLSLVQKSLLQKLLPLLEEVKEENASVDLQHVLLQLTMDIILMVIFGREAGSETFASAPFDEATECCIYRLLCPSFIWKVMRFLNVGFEKKLRAARAIVEDCVAEMVKVKVKEVEEENELQGDILSTFMRLEREQRCPPSQHLLQGLTTSIFLPGKDTTALAMSWFFWLISMHPYVEEKMVSELSHIWNFEHLSNGYDIVGAFGWEALRGMNYLQAALSEYMTLYPPPPLIYKEAAIDNVLPDGTHVMKGSKLLLFIYGTNRMESLWGKDALEFKPERWITEKGICMNENDYKYPVFSAGPRICIGKDVAYVSMKYIVDNILVRYRVKVEAGHQVKPKLGLTLPMKHGLKVTLQARNDIIA